MANFTDAKQQLKQMNVDKCLLRYLVINAENVRSTVSDDPLGCLYIYVKPGMYEKIIEVSNIDFVQEIYAQNGINLKKHISHLDHKETEVLFITVTDLSKLTDLQQDFVSDTAPTYSRHFTNSRATEIINSVCVRNEAKNKQNTR